MGKKDKEKRKKDKQDGKGGTFVVPKPPPWPLPGASRFAFAPVTKPSPSAAPAPVPSAAPEPAPASTPAAPVSAIPVSAVPSSAVPMALTHMARPAPAPIAPVSPAPAAEEEPPSTPAPATPVSGMAPAAFTPAAAAAASAFTAPSAAASDFDEIEPETLDLVDIADIAPVGPTQPLEDSIASSGQPVPGAQKPSVDELTQQIRELEARLDRMLDERRSSSATPAPRSSSGSSASATSQPRVPDLEWSEPPPAAPLPTSHDFLSSDFYLKKWGKAGMRQRAEEVDEFGFDPAYDERLRPFVDFLYRRYFRVDTQGVEHIPAEGRCVVVANHAGGPLPYDGLMLRAAIRREHAAKRDLRWLTEDFVFYLPFVGASLNRLGAVRACQENAERLLSSERIIGVFPEGAKGIGKLFGERYRLQRFGRGGFIRLCLRTNTPIVPCAIVGAEEANPTLYRVESLAKLVGLPYLPVTPTFPALGPAGLLPAPSKWKIRFGAPIRLTSYGPESADDDLLVSRLAEGVRTVIQEMLSGMLASRRSIWFG